MDTISGGVGGHILHPIMTCATCSPQSLREARVTGMLGEPLGLSGSDINIVNRGRPITPEAMDPVRKCLTSHECLESLKVNCFVLLPLDSSFTQRCCPDVLLQSFATITLFHLALDWPHGGGQGCGVAMGLWRLLPAAVCPHLHPGPEGGREPLCHSVWEPGARCTL